MSEASPLRTRDAARGAGLALALAAAAFLIARSTSTLSGLDSPALSPILCAILLGVAWRNTFGLDERWLPGAQWAAGVLLRTGIALIGLRLTLAGAGEVAAFALPVVAGCVATALLASFVIGRALGVARPLRFMIAAGSAICGCTAVIAVAPLTRARAADTSVALTCVVLLGAAGMLVYPWLASLAFATPEAAGVFLGTAIQDTSQVLGASMIYAQQFAGGDAAPYAALTKLLRNFFLLALVPAIAWSAARQDAASSSIGSLKLSQIAPPFLVWFVALAVFRTGGDALLVDSSLLAHWSRALSLALHVSEALVTCGIAAIGLSVSLRDLRSVAWRAIATAAAVALATAGCSFGLTLASETGLVRQLFQ